MQSFNVRLANINRVEIDFTDKPEQRLLRIGKRRRLRIGEHSVNKFDSSYNPSRDGRMISQQLRRDRGVGLRSKRAVIQM